MPRRDGEPAIVKRKLDAACQVEFRGIALPRRGVCRALGWQDGKLSREEELDFLAGSEGDCHRRATVYLTYLQHQRRVAVLRDTLAIVSLSR